jgi:proline iminopeptidase
VLAQQGPAAEQEPTTTDREVAMDAPAKGRTGHATGSVEARNPRRGLRRAGGWLLVLVAIPVGIGGWVVALLGLVALTGSRVAGALGGTLALVLVTGGVSRLGTRVISRSERLGRWLPGGVTGAVLAVVGTVTALLVFAPAPTYTPFPASDDWRSWDLPTGSRIAYTHLPARGAPRPTPVILVHGGPGAPQGGHSVVAPTLANAGFDVYQYHQVGAGLSERLEDVAAYTVARHVADLEALRRAIGAERVVLVGESWGGTLIAHYLAAHPDRVARAVVSSPGPIWAPAFAEGLTTSGRRDQREVISHYPRFLLAYLLLGTAGPGVTHTLLPDHQMDGVFEAVVGRLDLWSGCSAAQHPPGGAVHDQQAGVGFWANAMTARAAGRVADPRPALKGSPHRCWCCGASATTGPGRPPASIGTCCRTRSCWRSWTPDT